MIAKRTLRVPKRQAGVCSQSHIWTAWLMMVDEYVYVYITQRPMKKILTFLE